MDARSIAARLRAEGIAVTAHKDGTLTASLMKPRSESWSFWLRDRIAQFPVAEVLARVDRTAGDPYFAHAEVRFRLGPEPVTEILNAPQRACPEGAWYPTPSAATSAADRRMTGKSDSTGSREDVTAGRDRHFESSLGRGTDPRAESRATATTTNGTMEGSAHEVAKAEGAVIPAQQCDSLGWRPGSSEGPGRIPPGSAMVGRADSGRAA